MPGQYLPCRYNPGGGGLHQPPLEYCTDNAAMIALAGYRRFLKGELASMDLNPKAHLPL